MTRANFGLYAQVRAIVGRSLSRRATMQMVVYMTTAPKQVQQAWIALSFIDRFGKASIWYDSEESAKAKIDEIKDAINAYYASLPNTQIIRRVAP